MRARFALGLIAAAVPFGAAADFLSEGFRLAWPVDCVLGETCHIQNYVDHDPGPGWRDFACNALSYDTHKGTDIALATLDQIAQGVIVRAAAPGVVQGTRDGMADRLYTGQDLAGRDCGNGVVVDHDNGWVTQYCHLREGSLRVQGGDTVEQGQTLGEIGLSGRTQFAHLHISLRKDGTPVDPFAPDGAESCVALGGPTLWADPIPYTPGGLLDTGFATGVPEFDTVKAGTVDTALAPDRPLVLFGYGYGQREGDVLRLTITGPAGELFTTDADYDRPQAQSFRAGGRRAPEDGWPSGTYIGKVELRRNGTVIETLTSEAEMP